MKEELKKKLGELFEKMDGKILEAKMNQALEMIKNGEHSEIIKKLNGLEPQELLQKIQEIESLPEDNLENMRQKLGNHLKKEDLLPIKKDLNEDGKKIFEKLISTLKLK